MFFAKILRSSSKEFARLNNSVSSADLPFFAMQQHQDKRENRRTKNKMFLYLNNNWQNMIASYDF